MELLFGLILLLFIFFGGLFLSDFADRTGGSVLTMEERRAIVFEVYRYAVCFLMVIVFGLMAFQMVGAWVGGAADPTALAGPGVGAVISGLLFLIHWTIRNPALPKAAKPPAKDAGSGS